MNNEIIQEQNLHSLKERLTNNPGVILESLQERYVVSMAQILESLPDSMWQKVDGKNFVEVLTQIASIGTVTLIIHVANQIFEFKGAFPTGEISHGFYNLKGGHNGLHGHLKPEKCKSIYFIKRPFMKRDTASIQFINHEDEMMFKIFLGRTDDGEIIPEQLITFQKMASLEETEA